MDERREAVLLALHERDEDALWSVVHEYLTWHHGNGPGRGLSGNTARAYRRALAILLERWSPERILQPPEGAGRELAEALVGEGMSRATVKVYVAGMRALYRTLRWVGATWSAPFAGLSTSTRPEKQPRAGYRSTEVDALLAMADPYDRLLVLLCADAHLRAAECVAVRRGDVDLKDGRLRVGEDGFLTLSPRLRVAFQAVLRDDEEQIFPFTTASRARDRFSLLCRRAGVTYRGLDALRVTEQEDAPRSQVAVEVKPSRESRPAALPARSDGDLLLEVRRAMVEAERLGGSFAIATIRIDGLDGIPQQVSAELEEAIWRAITDRVSSRCRPYDWVTAAERPCLYVLLKHLPEGSSPDPLLDRFRRSIEDHPISVNGWRGSLRAQITVSPQSETSGRAAP